MCEAAAAICATTGLSSARALGREIAEQATAAMLDDARNDPAAILPAPVSKWAQRRDAARHLQMHLSARYARLFGTIGKG